jgi:type I restriction enzyme, S subunit
MIADLKPYEEYKESGLPWLGQVPAHWDVKRLKSAANIVMGQSPSSQDCSEKPIGLPFLQGCAEFGAKIPRPKQFCSDAPKRAPANAILLSVRAPVGRLNLADQQYGIGRGLCAVVPRQALLSTLYARYAIEAGVSGLMTFSTGSTYGAVRVGDVGVQPIPLPPPTEQAAIVRFLDWANGRLERAIRAKRKVIALLNEQKQAIIHRAVTRGLDPAVPLKPSGISWLGEIPAHWEVMRSKYIYKEVDIRSSTGQETHLSMSQRLGLVPSSQIEVRRLISESYVGAKLCEKGDLVLNRLKAHLGVFALAPEQGVVSPDYTILRPVREINERFFEAVYRTPACRVELYQRAKGIVQGFWRLYTDDFYDIRVPVPPVDEQKHIMAQLDIDLSGVKTANSRLEREIELLREYRTRLIADVVTGKLDVRAAAAQLPDEDPLREFAPSREPTPDDDPLDEAADEETFA